MKRNEGIKIPKIFHQLWIGPKPPPKALMKTWRDFHPEWKSMFWNEKTLAEHFPGGLQNQRQFDDIRELSAKADIARFEILYKFGGLSIDADSRCINKLDDYLLINDSFSCYENEIERGNLIACGNLGATPKNALMKMLIEGIGKMNIKKIMSLPEPDPWNPKYLGWRLVGPEYLTKTVVEKGYTAISIYPSYFFNPEHYTGTRYTGPAKSYGIHLWGSTHGSEFEGYSGKTGRPQGKNSKR